MGVSINFHRSNMPWMNVEVRMHDARCGRTVGRLPDAHAVSRKFPVNAVGRAFDGKEDCVDGGFVHVANIRVVISRCDEQVTMVMLAKIEQSDGVCVLRDDTCVGFTCCDGTKDTCCVHGCVLLRWEGCSSCAFRFENAQLNVSEQMGKEINKNKQAHGDAQQPRKQVFPHEWFSFMEGGVKAAFHRIAYRCLSNSLICFSASSLAMP